jgi:hypothetical protein
MFFSVESIIKYVLHIYVASSAPFVVEYKGYSYKHKDKSRKADIYLQNLKKTISSQINTLKSNPETQHLGTFQEERRKKKSSSQECWPGAYLKA